MPLQKTQVAVTIPVYKAQLTESEEVSLRQTVRVLKDYDLIIFAPEGLSLDAYLALYEGFQVERFPARYFQGVKGYNRLMLSSRFYGTFKSYAYILICQLDAYVFRDELLEWAAKDYDYIGAPFLVPMPITIDRPIIFDLSKRLVGKVGNGGLSLRKVSTHLRITRWFRPLIFFFRKNEDLFWSYFVPFFYPYKRPSCEEALRFAVDLAPRKAFEMLGERLPFGCHAWERHDPEFWKPYIPA